MYKRIVFLTALMIFLFPKVANAKSAIEINFPDGSITSSVDLFILITILSLIPPLVISLTCYVQVVMVLSLARQAIGTPTAPPNMVITGIALILTLFIMMPIIQEIKTEAYEPYKEGKIELSEAINIAEKPLKAYMVNNSNEKVIQMYAKIAGLEGTFESREDVPFLVASASSVTTQVTKALGIGAVLMLGFIVIDAVVATITMLLGMFMLPPHMISQPIKILVFLAAGGFPLLMEIVMMDLKM